MLEINPNILLFQHHPRLKTYIHSPIEQAINESLQTVQRSLKVATSAAETIVRKDFLLNPDEQQLRTSARNMVAYLSSGLVLITARPALQDQIQSYIKAHLQTVLGVTQTSANVTTTTNNTANDSSSNGTSTDQLSSQTREMIQQAATEIATSNIELCCCLLQRITIHRAIQFIDQRLASDIELRQRCRSEGRQLPTASNMTECQSDRLSEPIRLHYGPLSSHQLAIYEDFVHFIPGFKPSDNEKAESIPVRSSSTDNKHRDAHFVARRISCRFSLQTNESGPSVWDRLITEIEQTIQIQHNQVFVDALQQLLENVTILRTNLHNQLATNTPHTALTAVLNIIIVNLLAHYTVQDQLQDGDNLERFKNVHMSVLKVLVEVRLQMSLIIKQLTKAWLECSNELKFNVYAVNQLIHNRLLDIRQIDKRVAQMIDSANNAALHFAVNFLRNCVIEQPCCVDSDIASILDSLHRISLIGKQPAEAVRDLLEIIRLNYTSLMSNATLSNDTHSNGDGSTNIKIDKLAIISLSVISNGNKYLSSNDDVELASIANKAKHILNDWLTLTMTQTSRISQQQSFQSVFNQVNELLCNDRLFDHCSLIFVDEYLDEYARLVPFR
jgi:CCR4-NOT transcription complex subunit 1